MSMFRLAVFAMTMAATAAAHAADIRFMVTEVKDNRGTGQFFNNLEIKLKMTGDDAAGARGIRTVIASAVDDTGRNLLAEDEKLPEFKPLQDGRGPELELKFRNPARKASVVKEIAGEVQLFVPDQDPASIILVKNFRSQTGKPINTADLAKAGVQVTVLTKKEYETRSKQMEQQAAREAEKNLGQAMAEAFKGLFGALFQVGDNDVILELTDPAETFIKAEVASGKGTVIQTSSTSYADNLRVLGFDQPLPPDAQLRLFLKTGKSVISVPLKLTDIALP